MAKSEDDDDPFADTRMTLGEHLVELRRRLIRSAIAIVVALCVTWSYYPELTKVLRRPMDEALVKVDAEQREKYLALLVEEQKTDPSVKRTKYFLTEDPTDTRLLDRLTVTPRLSVLGPADGFFAAMKVSLYGALAVAGPILLWQMWQFIAAGLYKNERKAIFKYFPISLALFAGGVSFGYFVLCPFGFYFMAKAYPPEDINNLSGLNEYLGALFQLPLVMNALARLELVNFAQFRKFFPYFVVIAFVVGGIVTPPDPYTQTFVAVPAIVLYAVGMLCARLAAKKPAANPGARP
jgi:sec-independent protein translocase protein TatC